jgi:uncharacterized small protein (DUF1192 family)
MGKRKATYLAKLRLTEELDVDALQNNLQRALSDVKNLQEQLTVAQAEIEALKKKVTKSKTTRKTTTKKSRAKK